MLKCSRSHTKNNTSHRDRTKHFNLGVIAIIIHKYNSLPLLLLLNKTNTNYIKIYINKRYLVT